MKEVVKEQSAELIKEIDYMPNWYLLKAPTTSNGLLMSNIFYETGKEDAITTAINTGRNGKGMVVVFAAGNANIPTADYPASYSPDILIVGSMDSSNRRSTFSYYGTSVDVVAPGTDVWSTLSGNSTGNMSGTSMAAPHVAGLAALILSVNSNLTGKEVVNIIERTAQKVGNYNYTTTLNRTNGTWNNEMGYGLCNAFAAVSAAGGDIVTFNNMTVSSNRTVTGWVIHSGNVTVTNSAKLTFNACQSVTINTPFTVNTGSQLEIKTN